jgi:PEP-CTERM motif
MQSGVHRKMNIKSLLAAGAGALALAATAAPAQAYLFGFSDGGNNGTIVQLTLDGTTVVNSFDTGWYNGADHSTDNTNYIVVRPGDFNSNGYNNFFAFDLSNLTGSFSTATLTFNSYDVTETATYQLFDFGGSISSLVAGTGGLTAFNDLGSGTSYGAFGYGPSDSYNSRTLTLNAAAVADINRSLGGNFALGGTLEPGVAVPEPATWAMMLLGFFGLGGALRARKAAAALA